MSEKAVSVLQSFAEGTSMCFWRRAHEQDLSKRHERDLGELSVVHHRETHIMLADFNKAQEVLRDKISALQILWVARIFVLPVASCKCEWIFCIYSYKSSNEFHPNIFKPAN